MIPPAKHRHALHALHLVHVNTRLMAYRQVDHAQIAKVMDWAELLPAYLDARRDCTKKFRDALVIISEASPMQRDVVKAFDVVDAPRWHGEDVCPSA